MRRHALLLPALLLLSFPHPTPAQVAKALLVEDTQLPGAAAGEIISALNNTSVNHAGGYAVSVNTSDGGGTLSHVWGDAAGGAGTVLRTESTIGDYEQTSFESFFEIDDAGAVSYSATSDNTASGSSGLDGVWLDGSPIAVEEEAYPNQAGFFWVFGSRPGVTADGQPYWVGGFTDTKGGSTQNRGLFFGASATPLLLGGDAITGLPNPHEQTSMDFDYRLSRLGTHYIINAETVGDDNHVVIDDAVVMAGGLPISEGGSVPAAVGGLPGESWDNFDFMGINEAGNFMFTGDTDAAAANDEFVALDGVIVYREGDTIDGEVVSGSIEGAYMNEDRDVAYIWDIQGGAVEALFLNDALLLKQGDEIDVDGDGTPDAGMSLTNFTGISTLTLSDRGPGRWVSIYFTADVLIPPLRGGSRSSAGRRLAARQKQLGSEELGLEASNVVEDGGAAGSLAGVETECFLQIRYQVPLQYEPVREELEQLIATRPSPRPTRWLAVSPNFVAAGRAARVSFLAADGSALDVTLFDTSGRRVRTLAAGAYPNGVQTVEWDGRDSAGRSVAAGTYLLRYSAPEGSRTERVTILR